MTDNQAAIVYWACLLFSSGILPQRNGWCSVYQKGAPGKALVVDWPLLFSWVYLHSLNTIYLSLLDAKSTVFVRSSNYIFALTNPDMLLAFRNNLLWLICFRFYGELIPHRSFDHAFMNRPRYFSAVGHLVRRSRGHLEVHA
jgi:hypothetical protein